MGNQKLPAYMRGRSTMSGPIAGGYKIWTVGPYSSGGNINPAVIRLSNHIYAVEFGWHAEGTVVGSPTINPAGRASLAGGTEFDLLNNPVNLGTTPSGVATFDSSQTYYIDPSNFATTSSGVEGDFLDDACSWLRITEALGGGSFVDLFLWLVFFDLAHTTNVTEGLSTLEREKL